MSILINKTTNVLVQGITGKEGARGSAAMRCYGTNVVAGVTPNKGGQNVDGIPVFNTVREALDYFPNINATTLYVPPFAAKSAMLEAIECDIPLINVLTERVPIRDTAYCLPAAREKKCMILGPSSLGVLVPCVGRLGTIGGDAANEIFMPGPIGVISRSGGMTNELSWNIRKNGFGHSTVVHVGGDLLMGTTYADLLRLFEEDADTKAVILFGEHGGGYEFDVVSLIEKKEFTKPIAVYVGGKFASIFPEGMTIGHAGAIVGRGQSATEKETALKAVGVLIAQKPEELISLISPFV